VTGHIEQPASPCGDDFLLPALRRSRLPIGMPGRIHEARYERMRDQAFSIGLLVPTSGLEGIWGPSTIACARLAVEEINRSGGLLGKEVRLLVIDAADEAADLTEQTDQALEDGEIDAIVGMHISSVRQKLVSTVGGRVPYVYTPLYEGGECSPGVYAIGETTSEQLRPAIHALTSRFRLKRWALLGNDYVWPRISHALAKGYIREMCGEVVDDLYLPLGVGDFGPVLERLARLKADALLLSLIGQDAIAFNREFGSAGSRMRGMIRLSCAIEENGLLAIGTGNTDGLYATAGYFASVPTDANMAFKERYYGLLGERAPTLNTLGQSTYEGVQFLAALVERSHLQRRPGLAADLNKPIPYRSARETVYLDNRRKASPMYLARAEGHLLQVIERL
jgi:ABC-type branched-subunit amino acid transport system substrate-binding protein